MNISDESELNELSNRYNNHINLKNISLFEHQKTMLYYINKLEETNDIYNYGPTKVGIIGDFPGSGKSLTLLSQIINKPSLIPYKQTKFMENMRNITIGRDYTNSTFIDTNIIVVPHLIINQWEDYIKEYTYLKYYTIFKSKDILDNPKKYGDYDIILIKSTMYNRFIRLLTEDKKYNETEIKNPKYYEYLNELDLTNKLNRISEIQRKIFNISKWDFYSTRLRVNFNNLKNKYIKLNEINKTYLENTTQLDKELNNINIDDINYNYFNNVREVCRYIKYDGYVFNRLIIDEVDTINIPNNSFIASLFTWCICSSYNNLINYYDINSNGYIKDLFKNISFSYNNYDKLLLRNNEKYIKESLNNQLKEKYVYKYLCKTPKEIHLLKGIINDELIGLLNCGDKNIIKEKIKIDELTTDNIIEKYTSDFHNNLKSCKEDLDNINDINYFLEKINTLVCFDNNYITNFIIFCIDNMIKYLFHENDNIIEDSSEINNNINILLNLFKINIEKDSNLILIDDTINNEKNIFFYILFLNLFSCNNINNEYYSKLRKDTLNININSILLKTNNFILNNFKNNTPNLQNILKSIQQIYKKFKKIKFESYIDNYDIYYTQLYNKIKQLNINEINKNILIKLNKISNNKKNEYSKLHNKINSLEERLRCNDNCNICYNKSNDMINLLCCNNYICLFCFVKSYKFKNTCSFCRTIINNTNQLCLLNNDNNSDNNSDNIENKIIINNELNKNDTLNINLFDTLINNSISYNKNELLLVLINTIYNNNNKSKILIFSDYNNNSFINELDSNIIVKKLCGTTDKVSKLVNKFNLNDKYILFIDPKNLGVGINLNLTTDIILLHKMNEDTEKQIIGRGFRIGMANNINIHHILHNNEI